MRGYRAIVLAAEVRNGSSQVRFTLNCACKDNASAVKLLAVWLECIAMPLDPIVEANIKVLYD
jgi:hypothetical protein